MHADFTYVSTSATYSNSYLLTISGRPGSTGSYTKSGVFIHEYETGKYDIYELDTVREYLAGAYYVIKGDVELPSDPNPENDFLPLGSVGNTINDIRYAFRGVIVGQGNPTITNPTNKPLIANATGCVLKDFTVQVSAETAVSFNYTNYNGNFTYAQNTEKTAYGALIAQVMGGDNIIDCVQVGFPQISFSFRNATFNRYAPIGGYIGVLVNGGVIFRNMTSDNVGLTRAKLDKIADNTWLYINPIIGRVIAGYAFHETDTYRYSEDTATLKNGDKNYPIPDFNVSGGNLTLTGSSNSNITVSVPDGQAMFILSAIINTGAGSANYNKTTEQVYDNPYSENLNDTTNAPTGYTANAYYGYKSTRGLSTYDLVAEAANETFVECTAGDANKKVTIGTKYYRPFVSPADDALDRFAMKVRATQTLKQRSAANITARTTRKTTIPKRHGTG